MEEKLTELLQPILEKNRVYLDDMEYVQDKGEWYLRIYIEKIDGHLDMDTCVQTSEDISLMLDEVDLIKDEYYLEVSSPGAEKPLKTLEKVEAAIGEYVFIQLKKPVSGLSELYGTILNVDGQDIEVQYLIKNIKKTCHIQYDNMSLIRLAVKF